ncbi:nematocyst expressed protein 3-like [Macrobrachium nipponense]|uniref:nematocyst expressed protein 3-like n=1 Tax=Macrobrachium nipponense TaxID=159736 RepID=UPI0030C8026B
MDKILLVSVLVLLSLDNDFALGGPLPQVTGTPLVAAPGPAAPPATFFTPEVSLAMQQFMQEYNKQALISASFPDDPVPGQPLDATAPQLALFPTPPPPAPAPAPAPAVASAAASASSVQASFTALSGAASATAAASAPAPSYTIPEAYAQYYALLAPPPPPPPAAAPFVG